MNLREPCLPRGWYPREKAVIEEFLAPFKKRPLEKGGFANEGPSAAAAIAPHAGWYYSGVPAAIAVSSLDREAETVALIGGHLPPGAPIRLAGEDGVKTPFGIMKIDRELREEFKSQSAAGAVPDRGQDNTVEVLLPMVHCFFPRAELLWLRFPQEFSSYEAGKLLAKSAAKLKKRIVVIGSTDLTHYGENYGFSPKGRGKIALDWVKNVNDAAFIKAILSGDPLRVLKHAGEDFAACSAGAVLGALGFAGKAKARLLDYRTSADIPAGGETPDSFVGYTAISFV